MFQIYCLRRLNESLTERELVTAAAVATAAGADVLTAVAVATVATVVAGVAAALIAAVTSFGVRRTEDHGERGGNHCQRDDFT
jgi:hypothetical protein